MTKRAHHLIDTSVPCDWIPSPNFEARAAGRAPDLLLLHYTATKTAKDALHILTDPDQECRVSSHYLIDEEGMTFQLVSEEARAWHAGVACWRGEPDINSCSIGIEIHNQGHQAGCPAYPDRQMKAVEALCLDILNRFAIPPKRVLAHSDVSPLRKADPGEYFDWQRLFRAGVGYWVSPEEIGSDRGLALGYQGPEVTQLQSALRAYGYGIDASGLYDERTEKVVTAFQRHFRPGRIDGRADLSTRVTVSRLNG